MSSFKYKNKKWDSIYIDLYYDITLIWGQLVNMIPARYEKEMSVQGLGEKLRK